jgi:Spy/CpxP family protein refolding chaperone
VLRRLVLVGVLAGLVTATLAASAQHPQGVQRSTPQPSSTASPKDSTRDAQRGGPPGAPGAPGAVRFKWWQDPKVIAELHLAPDQSARIEEIWQTAATRMTSVVDDLRKREEQLSNLISGNDVTEAEVLKQADEVEKLRGVLGKSRTLMLYRMRRVLSAEQRGKLTDMMMAQDRDRRQGRPPDRGPGER